MCISSEHPGTLPGTQKAAELAQGGTTPSQMALASSYTTFFFLKGNSHVMVTNGLFP